MILFICLLQWLIKIYFEEVLLHLHDCHFLTTFFYDGEIGELSEVTYFLYPGMTL